MRPQCNSKTWTYSNCRIVFFKITLTVRYPLLSLTQPITTSLPIICPDLVEKPNPTHPVVSASMAKETFSASQSIVQKSFIFCSASRTTWWAYSDSRSAETEEWKAARKTKTTRTSPAFILFVDIWNKISSSCFISFTNQSQVNLDMR